MYQPVSPSSDPVPPSTEQYRLLLNQYHQISTSTAPYWPSSTKYQSIPTYTDPVPPSTNQYRLLLTQYHQVPTSTASHWPSTTKYQPVPPSTDPVPSYINQYRFILTQYHQVSTSTNLYCFCLGTTDSCTVYPGSCWHYVHNLDIIWQHSDIDVEIIGDIICPTSEEDSCTWVLQALPVRDPVFMK